MKSFIVAVFFLFLISYQSRAYDCLTVAHYSNDKELIDFYTFIAAAYNQMNTNPTAGKDEYNLLSKIELMKIIKSKDLSKEFLLFLNTLVSKEVKPDEFQKVMINWQVDQEFIGRYNLLNEAGIQMIHDAATYGDIDGPVLCPKGKALKMLEVLMKIQNYQELFKDKIESDTRHRKLEELSRDLPPTDPKLRIGAEFELFAPKYIKLFEQFIDSFKLVSSAKGLDIDTENFLSLIEKIKANTEKINVEEVLNRLKKVYYTANTTTRLEKIYLNYLPDDFKWLLLETQIESLHKNQPLMFIEEIFPFASMALLNFSAVEDRSGSIDLYNFLVFKIELAHKRPYKNARAYLESIILLFSENEQLMNMILYPQKQLDNDYTHHVHISYEGNDLSQIGIFMQDLIALSMLTGLTGENKENVFSTKNFWIKYGYELGANEKRLVRISVEGDKSRIELRRQVSGWSYNKLIAQLYKLITEDNAKAIDDLKAMNREKLEELKNLEEKKKIFIWPSSKESTAIEHIKKQNK